MIMPEWVIKYWVEWVFGLIIGTAAGEGNGSY